MIAEKREIASSQQAVLHASKTIRNLSYQEY